MDRKYKLTLVADDHKLLKSWIISTNKNTQDEDVDVTYPVPNYSALMVADEVNTAIRRNLERSREQWEAAKRGETTMGFRSCPE